MLSPASGNLPFNGRGRAKSRVELGHRCRGLVRSLQAKCYQSSKRFRCGKEQHYWVHPPSVAAATYGEAGVAIDRYTGQVLDKQIEVVTE